MPDDYENWREDRTKFKCPCGEIATYICSCGCLCCGEDPCIFNCGGSVIDIAAGLRYGIVVRKVVNKN